MGNTSTAKIPYVEPADLLANYPTAMKAQSDRIDALYSNRNGSRMLDLWTASAGWSITNQEADRYGPMIIFWVRCTRTGAAISIAASGDGSNTDIAIWDQTRFPIATYGPVVGTPDVGRLHGVYLGSGKLIFGAASGTTAIATGETLSCRGIIMTTAVSP